MNRVLIISPFYPPFPKPGATKRVENFVRYLPENGWEPVVLTMDWGPREKGREGPEKRYSTKNIAAASWRAYHIADVEQDQSWKAALMKKIIALLRVIKTYVLIPDELILWVCWAVPAARKIMKKDRPQVIYVSAPPNSSLLTAVVLKKMLKLPLVCDIRDDWSGNPIMEKKSALLRSLERKLEAWVVRASDAILLVTASSRAQWAKRYPELNGKFRLIPNGYSEDEYNAVPGHRFDDFALVHVGSLESNRSPELIYRALAKLGAKERKIGFYQYGLTLREYRDRAAQYGLQDVVRFEGTVTSDEALARIKGASLLVLLPTRNAPTAIPGKAYEYLRTGKPILMVSEENTTTEFMKKFSRVHHVLPDEEEKCADIISRICSDRRVPQAGTPDAEIAQFDRRNLTGSLAHEFDGLLGSHAGERVTGPTEPK